MTSKAESVQEIRAKIDAVDNQILELLNQRAELARAIGETKKKAALENGAPDPKFFDPEREQAIVDRLEKNGRRGSFPSHALPFVFKEIISACRSLEAPFRVAYLGPEGTYTQMAAEKIFGRSVRFVQTPTIEGIFDALSRGQAEYGVTPLENSYEGGVGPALDSLIRGENLFIRRQKIIRVDHCLISRAGNIGQIKRLYSHPQALGQCRLWIAKNLPGVEILASRSTAAAAHTAADDPQAAAIASRLSAELLGLSILREAIQDQRDNSTRFVVLAHTDAPMTGKDQTSVVLSLNSKPGALMKALKLFDDQKIPILRLESRAGSDRLWQYMYFVDFPGHRSDPRIARVLKRLASYCDRLKVLGSYPIEDSQGGD